MNPDPQDSAAEARPADRSQSSSGNPPSTNSGAQQVIRVRDDHVTASYANFCKVASTPEEVILDLGLNPNPFASGEVTVTVGQRVIMNHFTAKRLLTALSVTLQRHEQAFGVLETDVRKRVISPG